MKCQKCGKKNKPGDSFCQKCGHRLKKELKKITLGLIVSWILGVLLGISGLTFLFEGAIKSGAALILASLILLPPVNRFVEKEFNFEMSRGLKIVAVIILFIIYAVSYPSETKEEEPITIEDTGKDCTNECSSDLCDGKEFIECRVGQDGCKEKRRPRKILGKCGVDCLIDSDCSKTQECKDYQCSSKTVTAKLGHSRTKPVSMNTPLITKLGYSWSQEVDAEITLLGTKRGSSAWTMIKETNSFNDEPERGKEYLMAKVRFKLISTSDDKAYSISTFDFEAVSESGNVYENPWVVAPEPKLSKELYPGATHEGWVVFEVDKTDYKPLMVLDRDADGELWFKLY